MVYGSIGIIALIVQMIINYDVIFKNSGADRSYRRLLFGFTFYYTTDLLWGFFDDMKWLKMLFADTTVYFVAMGLVVMLWCHYVTDYLEVKTRFGKWLRFAGDVCFIVAVLSVIVNLFVPFLFSVSKENTYSPGPIRYLLLLAQIVMFTLTGVHTLVLSRRTTKVKRIRYITISVFGFTLAVLIFAQTFFPLLPLYGIGCMLGTCLLHTFIVEDEKAEYRSKLEELLKSEQEQRRKVGIARQLAYTDTLTGVKSRHAYLEMTDKIDKGIAENTVSEFGVVVFDINGLKVINDTLGHEEGDRFIREGCMMICQKFKHSPVFRIGGDEFVALLEGSDYSERERLLEEFDKDIDENVGSGIVVVSTGMDIYSPADDKRFSDVFERADRKMYERKNKLKSINVKNAE